MKRRKDRGTGRISYSEGGGVGSSSRGKEKGRGRTNKRGKEDTFRGGGGKGVPGGRKVT